MSCFNGSGNVEGKTAWSIGHAVSPDGPHWNKSGADPLLDVGAPDEWDSGTFMSFDVIFHKGRFLFWCAAASDCRFQ